MGTLHTYLDPLRQSQIQAQMRAAQNGYDNRAEPEMDDAQEELDAAITEAAELLAEAKSLVCVDLDRARSLMLQARDMLEAE
jgi:hypothetical protein